MSTLLGIVFYSIVVFVAGAFIGRPMFTWASSWLPWNK
jgi:hypothetical protein